MIFLDEVMCPSLSYMTGLAPTSCGVQRSVQFPKEEQMAQVFKSF